MLIPHASYLFFHFANTYIYCLIVDFSLSTYISTNNLPSLGQLSSSHVSKLLEILGISKYMKQPACEKDSGIYEDAYQGWKSGKIYLLQI